MRCCLGGLLTSFSTRCDASRTCLAYCSSQRFLTCLDVISIADINTDMFFRVQIFDGDIIYLYKQSRTNRVAFKGKNSNEWAKAYYLPGQSDRCEEGCVTFTIFITMISCTSMNSTCKGGGRLMETASLMLVIGAACNGKICDTWVA